MKNKTKKWIASLLGFGAALVLLDSLFLEKYFFQVKSFNIGRGSGRKKGTFILLSDLHLKNSLLPHYYKLARKVNSLEPDLVFITGDVLDTSGKKSVLNRFLCLLNSDIPKVAIPGNHDHYAKASLQELTEVFACHNGTLLVNQSKVFCVQDVRVMVTGLDDFISGQSDLCKAVDAVGHEKHHILLIHSPLQQEQVKKELAAINSNRSASEQLNISYIFAGHNHGGQVRLPFYVPVLPPKSGEYVQGWYNRQAPFLYVSRGFGTSTIPFRFDAPSELTVFNYFA
ncbi:MAG: metallophosphoesterase [Hymenobacteraceae bacterium]|nr:metallophosphoesterase [Hymenobacteraceae bacterium]MDX5395568.1 metallophosphoesterase [Hymenobacteraceae bacterium]MDX5511620.1 metallophosphoesterase [Hymenobacteraceae bacterium]